MSLGMTPSHKYRRLLIRGSGIACFALLHGCGGATARFPDTVPFKGRVTLNGVPLQDATIVFTPVIHQGVMARGFTNDKGEYELGVTMGSELRRGAVPGDYKIHLSTAMPTRSGLKKADERPLILEERVPANYRSVDRTLLKATIPATGGAFDFNLEGKATLK